MSYSIIISYKESDNNRRRNLINVLNYLSWLMIDGSEIIIVEQDTESKIDWLNDIKNNNFIKHVFIKNSGIFNKGWGYNIGAKIAKNDILIFNDTDVILKLDTYKSAVFLLKKYDVVNPYKNIIFLDDNETNTFIKNNYNYHVLPFNKKIESYVISGGVFLIKKNVYLDIKGFDENCYGYGHEDDIFDIKIKKLNISHYQINDISVHFYHDKIDNNYYNLLSKNKEIYNNYLTMSVDDLKLKIGMVLQFGEFKSDILINDKIKMDIINDMTNSIIHLVINQITDDIIDKVINDNLDEIKIKISEILSEKLKKKLKELKIDDIEKDNFFKKIKNKFLK